MLTRSQRTALTAATLAIAGIIAGVFALGLEGYHLLP